MSGYKITKLYDGSFVLTIGDELVLESKERQHCERMKATLEDSTHAERVLRNTYDDASSNEIRDGIEAR